MSHPTQIVTFDYAAGVANPSQSFVTLADNTEVPYQSLSNGRIAVLTALPARTQREFRLQSGRAPAAVPGAVQVVESPAFWEVTNGLTGVRIPRTGPDLAPIQGVRLKDGVWTSNGPVYLQAPGEYWAAKKPAISLSARLIDRGPLVTTAELTYTFGSGTYRATLKVQAGQSSVMIEEDSTVDLQYYLDVFDSVRPNEARYRGHSAQSAYWGREPDGRVYRPAHERPGLDAVRSLNYAVPTYTSNASGLSSSNESIKRIAMWNPWAIDTGWYWMLYQKEGTSAAPLIGFFAGRSSRALKASRTGPGVYTLPWDGNKKRASGGVGVTVSGSSGRTRVEWGLFVGTKGTDAIDPWAIQNIGRAMNLNGGVNLDKISRIRTIDGSFGATSLFMTKTVRDALVARVRAEPSYYQYLSDAEPSSRPLLDAWRDTTGAKARSLLLEISTFAGWALRELTAGEGIYHMNLVYWMGGLEFSRRLVYLNDLMLAAELTAAEKQQVKSIATLFGSLLFDNDYVPMFSGHDLNMGTANMPVQQGQYRSQFALALAGHPAFSEFASGILAAGQKSLDNEINEFGTHRASPHYVSASMGPLLNTGQQLKVSGSGDMFAASADRLTRFGGFLLNLITPADPRFGGKRKMVSFGDGSSETSELFGLLGTVLAPVNPDMSRKLFGAWGWMDKPQSGFHGTTVLQIDASLPSSAPVLNSAAYPGYYSVQRQSAGTANETAAWVINGDYYLDHRHGDAGSVSLYALGAPMSVDWGSTYYPQAAGPYMHSSILPDSGLGRPWDADNVPLNGGAAPWRTAVQEAFEPLPLSSRTVSRFTAADGTVWRRTLRMIAPVAETPIIDLRDSFSGPAASQFKVMTLNQMARGAVEGPFGWISIPTRTWSEQSSTLRQLPSATPPISIPAGLNRFRFTGEWQIDWDLYLLGSKPQQVMLGNWAHTWHPNPEMTQFWYAQGRGFEERQHILRVHSDAPYSTLILPYKKGMAPAGRSVTESGGIITVKTAANETLIGPSHWAFRSSDRVSLTSNGASATAYGITMLGGPGEVSQTAAGTTITLTGAAGTRQVTINGVTRSYTFAGGTQTIVW